MISSVVRRPAVAGYYYPADPLRLGREVERCAIPPVGVPRLAARAVVVPHGSYGRCGAVIGSTLARVTIPRRCLVLGPSHVGHWKPWSVMEGGAYRTPLGDVPIDVACAEALRARCPFLHGDPEGQRGEHAVEVVLPFLQRLGPPDLTLVPIIVGSDDPDELARLAEALAQVVRMSEEEALLIASSDLSHYESQARGQAQDAALLLAICSLDPSALIHSLHDASALMCGASAVACVLKAATALGATRASVMAYETSADAGGDPHSVIGYAGVVVH